jgi:hypothetical protein
MVMSHVCPCQAFEQSEIAAKQQESIGLASM